VNLHFTEPGEPLFIEIETDEMEEPDGEGRGLFETFFAIATTRVDDDEDDDSPTNSGRDKRAREESASIADRRPAKRRQSQQVVTKVANTSVVASQATLRQASRAASAIPPPPPAAVPPRSQVPGTQATEKASEPLFLQPSQLSQREQEILQQSGWGDGAVDYDEFVAFMDDEGEEVNPGRGDELVLPSDGEAVSSKDDSGEEERLPATQVPTASVRICPFRCQWLTERYSRTLNLFLTTDAIKLHCFVTLLGLLDYYLSEPWTTCSTSKALH
jgi:hypothetical protein